MRHVRCGDHELAAAQRADARLARWAGVISMGYGGLWGNTTTPNVMATMVPMTAVELGEGFVVGRERTITKLSGVYGPPASVPHNFSGSLTFVYEDCYLAKPPLAGGLSVAVALPPRGIAVVVWTA